MFTAFNGSDALSRMAAKRNIEVTAALSGSQAIQGLRRGEFDVAILDLKMEDMDGIEVLKIFKKMDERAPVIMLTGHGSEQAVRDGIAFGAYDYLTKPCDLEELMAKIMEACQGKGGPSE